MKLCDAYLCLDCKEVFEEEQGYNAKGRYVICPVCCNRFNMSLSKVLNRKAIDEKVDDTLIAGDRLVAVPY
uniref:Uncharacterized protein n=1 Tax=viral metagenome TaxID=1070528 RepID=A0A6M3M1N4_9ZZZZ